MMPIEVTVHYTTQLRAAIGVASQTVTLAQPATVGGLIRQLAEQYPRAFSELVFDSAGELLPNLMVCVNDQQVTEPLGCPLPPGSQVLFLSAISGG